MRKLGVLFLGLIISFGCLPAGSAWAWEFDMQGAYVWDYDVHGQIGRRGFFGPYDVDNGVVTFGTARTLNGWMGQRMSDMVSGTDGSRNYMYMISFMNLTINPAFRIRGSYYIGAWQETGLGDGSGLGQTVSSQYLNSLHPGVQRSFSPGYWNTLWTTLQLPWGLVTYGKRPFIFGTGLQWNGEENRSNENLMISADYGPMRFQLAFQAARRGLDSTQRFQPPFGIFPNDHADYYNDADKTGVRLWDVILPAVIYRNGPLDAGIMVNFMRYHRGPEGRLIDDITRQGLIPRTMDRTDFYGGAYVKYNNGRFFFNSEFDWYNRVDRFSGFPGILYQGVGVNNVFSLNLVEPTSLPIYIEAYRVMAEFGAICGPAKISFLYAWMNGPDRRNGQTAGINQGAFSDHTNVIVEPVTGFAYNPNPRFQSEEAGNSGVFRPYSLLMNQAYGLGAYINADAGNGYVDDASVFAARLDYALAVNLNVFGSFFWADRVGNGYGWGYLSPLVDDATNWTNGTNGPTSAIIGRYRGSTVPGSGLAIAPNIPDNNLGWEIMAGMDWKILEGITLNSTVAYWQPGRWFNFACIDKHVRAWDQANSGAGPQTGGGGQFGINPDRQIDPIWGLELKVGGAF